MAVGFVPLLLLLFCCCLIIVDGGCYEINAKWNENPIWCLKNDRAFTGRKWTRRISVCMYLLGSIPNISSDFTNHFPFFHSLPLFHSHSYSVFSTRFLFQFYLLIRFVSVLLLFMCAGHRVVNSMLQLLFDLSNSVRLIPSLQVEFFICIVYMFKSRKKKIVCIYRISIKMRSIYCKVFGKKKKNSRPNIKR